MLKRILLTFVIALPLMVASLLAQESEDARTRPNRQEIISSMVKVGRIPTQQQNSKIDSLWQDLSASKTPRSDFMFCIGLAYLGNYKAQRCVGEAYENGRGIVEDLSEAYAWYSVAADSRIPDKAAQEKIEADKDRVQNRLLAAYPHPTEDELADLVSAQKSRISQYQQDVKSATK